jgi:hypothetical protein
MAVAVAVESQVMVVVLEVQEVPLHSIIYLHTGGMVAQARRLVLGKQAMPGWNITLSPRHIPLECHL